MLIRSIRLLNVKSHEDTELEFTPGVNAIMGPNGSGKSSVIEAIGFALFDVLRYDRAAFVRESEKNGSVWLTFASRKDGRDYLVERSVKGTTFRVSDCESNLPLVKDKVDVLRFIRQHLGLDETADLQRIFTDAVGVEQGMLTAAFQLSEVPRKAVFDPLLQVEDYRLAYKNLNETASLFKSRMQESALSIASLASLVDTLPQVRADVGETERVLHESQEMLDLRRTALERAQGELSGHEQRKQEVQASAQARTLAEMKVDSASEALRRAEGELAAAQEAVRVVSDNLTQHNLYLAAQTRKAALDAEVRQRQQLEKEQSALLQQRSGADRDLDAAVKRLAELADVEARSEALRLPAEQQLSLQQERTKAAADEQQLRFNKQAHANASTRLKQATDRFTELQRHLSDAEVLRGELSAVETLILVADRELAAMTDSLVDTEALGKAARTHLTALREADDTCPFCGQEITPGHRAHLLAEAEHVVEGHRESYRAAKDAQTRAKQSKDDAELRRKMLWKKLEGAPTQKQVDAAAEPCESLRREAEAAEQSVSSLAHLPAQLADLDEKLQAIGNPVADRAVALEQLALGPKFFDARDSAQAALVRLDGELSRVATQLAPYADLDARLASATEELDVNNGPYQLVIASRSLAESAPQREAARAAWIEALSESQRTLDDAIAAAAQAVASYSDEAHEETQRAVREHTTSVGALSRSVELYSARLQEVRSQLAGLEAQEVALTAELARQDDLAEQKRALEKMRVVIRDAGPRITSLRLARINERAREIHSDLLGDYSRRLKWDETYEISVEVDGRERAFKSLSGGEQMVAALSVRLAMLKEMTDLRIAFFDEPTANLDPERRTQLAAHIAAIRGFEQVFVISHDDTFESSTVNAIHLQNAGGRSQRKPG